MTNRPVKKIAVFDQGHPVFWQLMTKAKELFPQDAEFIRIAAAPAKAGETGNESIPEGSCDDAASVCRDHMTVIRGIEEVVRREEPDLLLLGATALGEEAAPALGIRLRTGVAAHCVEINVNEDGQVAYMVPAFGGKVIGEIFIPESRPMIATVKPGIFRGSEETAGEFRTVCFGAADEAAAAVSSGAAEDSAAKGSAAEGASGLRLLEVMPRQTGAAALEKAKVIVCGGFGIGSEKAWQKCEELAARLGGAAGCTRPVVDMGWGPAEDVMIGTSGKTVRPKVYLGLGISGAAHHLCGIRDADVIININTDKDAESFAASDHVGVFDAERMLDQRLEKTE